MQQERRLTEVAETEDYLTESELEDGEIVQYQETATCSNKSSISVQKPKHNTDEIPNVALGGIGLHPTAAITTAAWIAAGVMMQYWLLITTK